MHISNVYIIMKNNNTVLSFVSLGTAILAVIIMLATNFNSEIVINQGDDDRTISVSGEAERLVAPDTANITFSMTRKSTSLSEATDSVNTRVGEIVDALSEYGVEDKDVKTTNYSVYPEYDYNRGTGSRTFSGYRVTQSLELVIRDLDQVSPIMTAVAAFEVDNVSGLSFYVDEDEEILQDLRAEAIADAKAKARELERELGVSLDTIVGFSEQGEDVMYPIYNQRVYGAGDMAAEVEEATIPTGENTYNARVHITYKID